VLPINLNATTEKRFDTIVAKTTIVSNTGTLPFYLIETNSDLSRKLAHAMSRPFWAPNVPAFVLRMVFGEMSGILLASHRMNSSKIVATGYEFEHPELDGALQEVFA